MSDVDGLMNAPHGEYDSLRFEQIERIKSRDTFVNFNIVSMAVLLAAAFGDADRPLLLVLIPFVNLAFGWTFIINDNKIAAIAAYLEERGRTSDWERFRRGLRGSWIQWPAMSLLVQVGVFVVPSWLSIAAFVYATVKADAWTPLAWAVVLCSAGISLFLLIAFLSARQTREARVALPAPDAS